MSTPAQARRKALAQLARDARLTKRLQAIDGTLIEPGARRNKWNARKTEYRGNVYDSLAEAEYASYLDSLVVAGQVVDWERQCSVTLLDGPKASNRTKLIVDFWVCYAKGNSRYEDVKGKVLPAFNLKVKMWQRSVPHELWVVTRDDSGRWQSKQVATGILPAWLEQYR